MLSASMKRPLSPTRSTVVAVPVSTYDENFSSSGSSTCDDMAAVSYLSGRPPLKRMKCSTLSDMIENSSIEFDVRTYTTDQSMEIEDGELAVMHESCALPANDFSGGGTLEQVAQAAALSMEPNQPTILIPRAQLLSSSATATPNKRKLRYSGSSTLSSCSLAVSQSSIRTERSASNDEDDLFDVDLPETSMTIITTPTIPDEDPILIESLVSDWSHNFYLQVPKQQRTKSQVQAARRTIHRTHFLTKKQSSLSL